MSEMEELYYERYEEYGIYLASLEIGKIYLSKSIYRKGLADLSTQDEARYRWR
ncbi:hypothetical protein [Shimazuella kribbensis]|uniref:hypothetical protein n=1 Tax=Shimazuella kribbensis TaxID=139808 RepID=UPI000415C10C|nr:hypothetical protein [Shimazuella kribbensis]